MKQDMPRIENLIWWTRMYPLLTRCRGYVSVCRCVLIIHFQCVYVKLVPCHRINGFLLCLHILCYDSSASPTQKPSKVLFKKTLWFSYLKRNRTLNREANIQRADDTRSRYSTILFLTPFPLWHHFFPLVNMLNVTRITLSHNKIAIIPPGIANLINLEILNLANNQIEELPVSLSSMPKLRILNVSINKLNTLPRGFGAFPVLEVLDLLYNNLNEHTLPGNFFMMGKFISTLWTVD